MVRVLKLYSPMNPSKINEKKVPNPIENHIKTEEREGDGTVRSHANPSILLLSNTVCQINSAT